MIYRQNLHTHTIYCDGKNTPEEMVEHAISLGFSSIGFSAHSYMSFSLSPSLDCGRKNEYIREISRLKKKYKDKINLYCGLEFDMCSEKTELNPSYDYIIGAMHYFKIGEKYVGFDRDPYVVKNVIDQYFAGDGLKMAKAYYETYATLPKFGRFDIVAHFDLIAKHSDFYDYIDVDSFAYKSAALESIRELIKAIPVFEVNTGGIARGYRKKPYLAPFMVKEINRLGGGFIISSDCHNKQFLDCYFDDAIEYIRTCGVKEVLLFNGTKFEGMKI